MYPRWPLCAKLFFFGFRNTVHWEPKITISPREGLLLRQWLQWGNFSRVSICGRAINHVCRILDGITPKCQRQTTREIMHLAMSIIVRCILSSFPLLACIFASLCCRATPCSLQNNSTFSYSPPESVRGTWILQLNRFSKTLIFIWIAAQPHPWSWRVKPTCSFSCNQ